MKRKSYVFFLQDIDNSLDRIFKYTNGMKFEDFIIDEKTIDAVERNFEIVGEAVKNLPEYFKQKYPEIPFRKIAGMRDKLIHDYFGIDYELVWNTIKTEIPVFHTKIKFILKQIKNG